MKGNKTDQFVEVGVVDFDDFALVPELGLLFVLEKVDLRESRAGQSELDGVTPNLNLKIIVCHI